MISRPMNSYEAEPRRKKKCRNRRWDKCLLFLFILLLRMDSMLVPSSTVSKANAEKRTFHTDSIAIPNSSTRTSFPNNGDSNEQRQLVSYPKFSFFVMGDTPYTPNDAKILVDQVDQISKKDALFLVHVGDLMKRGKCRSKSYREASNILFGGSLSDPSPSFRPLPTFVIPGDNDWVDCPDIDIAYKRFTRFFVKNNNSTHGMDKQLSFQRQSQRKENFVLWKHNVLFLGLNMLGRQEITWRKRYEENTQWFQDQTEKYRSEEIRMIVIFAHSGNSNHPVYRTIQRFSRKSGIPILYIHGNGHFFKIVQHRKKFARLQVDRGGIAQPLKVTIGDSSPVKRRDFEFFSGLVQVARKWDV